jgi:hypothetical protein
VIEALRRMIFVVVSGVSLPGISMGFKTDISHLLFADDT